MAKELSEHVIRVPPDSWGHYKNFWIGVFGLIDWLFYLFLFLIILVFFIGLLFEGTPFAFLFIFAAAFFTILLGAALYSEGITNAAQTPIDVIVSGSTSQIDFNASRALAHTAQNDIVIAMLAPSLFYGGIIGFGVALVFLVKSLKR